MSRLSTLSITTLLAAVALTACVDLEPSLGGDESELVHPPGWNPIEPLPTPAPLPGLPGHAPDDDGGWGGTHITQQEGLRLCFYELEVDVRGCHYAFPNDVAAHNACIEHASVTYDGCLAWVQTLPYETDER